LCIHPRTAKGNDVKSDVKYEFALVSTTYYHLANLLERHVQTQRIPLKCTRRTTDWAHLLEMTEPGNVVPTITFEVIKLADDRIGVTARCLAPGAETTGYLEPAPEAADWLEGMMAEIERYWPDVRRPATSIPEQREQAGKERKIKKKAGQPRMNIGTAERVAKARLYHERDGVTRVTACGLAGVHYRTYQRWRDDPIVLKKLEELKKQEQVD
jgi:hypothetical protein